jgi:peptidoglycan/xylan/chitin deacetylase (PgdA/CDA1 family)
MPPHDADRHPLPRGFRWPDGVRAAALFSFDMDAEAAMLADHPETAGYLDVLAHQRYGPRTGVPRLLRMLDRLRLRTTFFIPGRLAETWPDLARSVRNAGHEIGHHGYLHESVHGVGEETELGELDRGLAALDEVLGVRPVGYRAPSWDMNLRTPGLVASRGFRYDSGLMDADHPYRLATGPGPDAPTLVELPVHWSLDDWNRYNYVPGLTGTGVIGRPSEVCAAWAEELDATVEVGGMFTLTMHPFVSGRPARAAALERLIERAAAIDGLWLAAGDEIAAWVETLDLPAIRHDPPVVP